MNEASPGCRCLLVQLTGGSFTSTAGAGVRGGLMKRVCRHPGHCDAWSPWWWWEQGLEEQSCEDWECLQIVVLGQKIQRVAVHLTELLVMGTD
jgi:hypothetical protein